MSEVPLQRAGVVRALWGGVILLLGGCGELHYVSPELASAKDPRAARVMFPFYTHSGHHRIDHLTLERINDIDLRGYAGALVPAGTYRFLYDCQMDRAGKAMVKGNDRVKTLILEPGHSYLLRTAADPGHEDAPRECHLSVRFCEPGQQIEKSRSRYLRDSWNCRAG